MCHNVLLSNCMMCNGCECAFYVQEVLCRYNNTKQARFYKTALTLDHKHSILIDNPVELCYACLLQWVRAPSGLWQLPGPSPSVKLAPPATPASRKRPPPWSGTSTSTPCLPYRQRDLYARYYFNLTSYFFASQSFESGG